MNHCTPDNHWECPVKHYDDTLRKSQIYRATYNQPNRQVVPTERRSFGSQKGTSKVLDHLDHHTYIHLVSI